MPYIEGRVVHDADAHIMEEPTWLIDHADPGVRERLQPNVALSLSPEEEVDAIEEHLAAFDVARGAGHEAHHGEAEH